MNILSETSLSKDQIIENYEAIRTSVMPGPREDGVENYPGRSALIQKGIIAWIRYSANFFHIDSISEPLTVATSEIVQKNELIPEVCNAITTLIFNFMERSQDDIRCSAENNPGSLTA